MKRFNHQSAYSIAALFIFSLLTVFFVSCGGGKKATWGVKTEIINEDLVVPTDGNSGKMFDLLTGKSTGIDFTNQVDATYKVNFYAYRYAFNGGGVGVGDFNNDGLQDVFVCGNIVEDKLYINKGDLKFEDVTGSTGILDHPGFSYGVSVVDINGDGWQDIYVCRTWFEDKPDMLFINNGDLTFTESHEEYGLISNIYSTQANFFDADNDGDMDLYLVSHPDDWNEIQKLKYFEKIADGKNQSDMFFRNDNGKFVDVSKEAGIDNHGYGLSATVGDINADGYMDIFVANDFVMYDFLYMNNGDGTFTDKSKSDLTRNCFFTMGSDVVDVNNDGLLDIFAVDMDLEDNYTVKTFSFVNTKESFERLYNGGYHSQYVGNSFHMNTGAGHFAEIARFAGISTTGWSWSPLFFDADNDGDRDLFVSNGYGRDFHVDHTGAYHKLRRAVRINDSLYYDELRKKFPVTPLTTPNAIFENNGDLTFSDQRVGWGIYYPSASFGAAYADFDNDGDIDLLCNNLNSPLIFYRNNNDKLNPDNNYLNVSLNGPKANAQGFGTEVECWVDGKLQYSQHTVIRGYISTSEDRIHFGLGKNESADKIVVTWFDGKQQVLTNVPANQHVEINYSDAKPAAMVANAITPTIFNKVTDQTRIDYTHKENDYDDFDREYLLPHKLSYLGPGASVGDVNGDGNEDFFVGGAQGSTGRLYSQKADGTFSAMEMDALNSDSKSEDMGSLFFDADADGDMDLYVCSGGSDFSKDDAALQDRLYTNDGKGNFTKSSGLPAMITSTNCVIAADYDMDGDHDLFVGGRVAPSEYPSAPRSYLLKNDGKGNFSDATAEDAAELSNVGMISDARWSDYNNDNKVDLVLVGEWMPLTVFQNEGGKLTNKTAGTGISDMTGWWNSLTGADFDNDGDIDYIAGNFGINCKYKPDDKGPIDIYADDFDGSGTIDIMLGYYQNGVCYPIKSRERWVEQCPSLQDAIPTWDTYGKMSIEDMFGKEKLENAAFKANAATFKTAYFENKGDGTFEFRDMNNELQISSIFGLIPADFDQDGNLDLLSHGNFFHPEVETNRQDASIGMFLKGNGDGTFESVSVARSGFLSKFDAKGLILINQSNGPLVLGINNNGPIEAFGLNNPGRSISAGPSDDYALIKLADGSTSRVEFPKGNGYLSAGTNLVFVPKNAREITFYNYNGDGRSVYPSLQASR